eukprot:PhM_4_TR15971/c0_g1_i1/m.98036
MSIKEVKSFFGELRNAKTLRSTVMPNTRRLVHEVVGDEDLVASTARRTLSALVQEWDVADTLVLDDMSDDIVIIALGLALDTGRLSDADFKRRLLRTHAGETTTFNNNNDLQHMKNSMGALGESMEQIAAALQALSSRMDRLDAVQPHQHQQPLYQPDQSVQISQAVTTAMTVQHASYPLTDSEDEFSCETTLERRKQRTAASAHREAYHLYPTTAATLDESRFLAMWDAERRKTEREASLRYDDDERLDHHWSMIKVAYKHLDAAPATVRLTFHRIFMTNVDEFMRIRIRAEAPSGSTADRDSVSRTFVAVLAESRRKERGRRETTTTLYSDVQQSVRAKLAAIFQMGRRQAPGGPQSQHWRRGQRGTSQQHQQQQQPQQQQGQGRGGPAPPAQQPLRN